MKDLETGQFTCCSQHGDTVFHYFPDYSGVVYIGRYKDKQPKEIAVPFEDLKDFIAEALRFMLLEKIEKMTTDEILKIGE